MSTLDALSVTGCERDNLGGGKERKREERVGEGKKRRE